MRRSAAAGRPWVVSLDALEFFHAHLPFWRMQEADALTDTPSDWVALIRVASPAP